MFSLVILLLVCNCNVSDGNDNPKKILISEVLTKDRSATHQSMFLELERYTSSIDIGLDGYSVVVAQTSTSTNRASKKSLEVLLAIDLSDKKMVEGQKFMVIGRDHQEAGNYDTVPFQPNSKFRLVNKQLNSYNWLSVEDKRHVIIFLVYSDSKTIFEDNSVWPYSSGPGNKKKMDPDLETYILANLVDVLIVHGISAPETCNVLHSLFVPEHLDEVNSFYNPIMASRAISISRCGLQFKKFAFSDYKATKPTPGKYFKRLRHNLESRSSCTFCKVHLGAKVFLPLGFLVLKPKISHLRS